MFTLEFSEMVAEHLGELRAFDRKRILDQIDAQLTHRPTGETRMKTLPMENATLDCCVAEAQRERVILTRNGDPIALVVGVEGMHEEQIRLSSSPEFWKLIEESRRQKTISREELERRLDQEL